MKRSGPHEPFIREYRREPGGITAGPPILQFQGVLTGVPTLVGAIDLVMPAHGPSAR
jgi:circadian clock protein KaiC